MPVTCLLALEESFITTATTTTTTTSSGSSSGGGSSSSLNLIHFISNQKKTSTHLEYTKLSEGNRMSKGADPISVYLKMWQEQRHNHAKWVVDERTWALPSPKKVLRRFVMLVSAVSLTGFKKI